MSGPSARARSRARSSSGFCSVGVDGERDAPCGRARRRSPDRPHAAPASASAGAPPAPVSALAQRDLVGRNAPVARDAIEHAVARALRDARPSGRAGALPATAASRPAARLRRATAASAPCRNRRARPRARLRDCRHRARGRDRARGSRPCSARARAAIARTIWRSLASERALGARLEQARDLHGDGRAARDDAAVA